MNLALLFRINALAMAAAGVVLFVFPAFIPSTIGIRIERDAFLMSYLLGGAEFGLATLCWAAAGLSDANSLRVATLTCIVLHGTSGVGELIALSQGVSPLLWLNLVVRALMIALFWHYGRHRAHTSD